MPKGKVHMEGGTKGHQKRESEKTIARQENAQNRILNQQRARHVKRTRQEQGAQHAKQARQEIRRTFVINRLGIAEKSHERIVQYKDSYSVQKHKPWDHMVIQLEWAQHEKVLSNPDCACALLALNRVYIARKRIENLSAKERHKEVSFLNQQKRKKLWKTAARAIPKGIKGIQRENAVQERISFWMGLVQDPHTLHEFLKYKKYH